MMKKQTEIWALIFKVNVEHELNLHLTYTYKYTNNIVIQTPHTYTMTHANTHKNTQNKSKYNKNIKFEHTIHMPIQTQL